MEVKGKIKKALVFLSQCFHMSEDELMLEYSDAELISYYSELSGETIEQTKGGNNMTTVNDKYADWDDEDYYPYGLGYSDGYATGNSVHPKYNQPVTPPKNTEWTSDLKVIKATQMKINLPSSVLGDLQDIHSVIKSSEFSIYVDYYFNDNGEVVIKEDIVIPEQEVTTGSVEYNEDPAGFKGVIHRHPAGARSFSGVDDQYINSNFDVSILFIPPSDFPQAIVNLTLANGDKIQVQAKVEVVHPRTNRLTREQIEAKIKERKYTYTPGKYGTTGTTRYGTSSVASRPAIHKPTTTPRAGGAIVNRPAAGQLPIVGKLK